uniref:Uncharacterized protein n=1 Tax=Arundo donax TaxID=35708 RepID=A0A0A8Y0P0_ARUDO
MQILYTTTTTFFFARVLVFSKILCVQVP